MYFLVSSGQFDTNLYIPFYKEAVVDLAYLYVPFGAFVIVGSSNAVNLTDGLDGLAIGPIITSALTLPFWHILQGTKSLVNIFIYHMSLMQVS